MSFQPMRARPAKMAVPRRFRRTGSNRSRLLGNAFMRPEFEPETPAERAAQKPRVIAWLRLMRLPNVFTAISDVAMGYLFVHHRIDDATSFLLLVAASACL